MVANQTHAEPRTQTHDGITWIDLENPSQAALEAVQHTYSLDALHVKECVQKVQHVQIEREQRYLFLVLHVPVLTARRDTMHITQVGVFLGKDYLITIRSGASPCTTDLFEVCNLSPEKADEYFKQGSAYLLYRVINHLLNDISEMTDDVNNELDEIEDMVFDNKDSDSQRIGKLRQRIVRLGRLIGPKRFILQDLAEQINSFTGQNMAKYYSNNVKMASKLWEEIEEAKETVEIYKDADFIASTEQTNRILAILTLVFTFTIPITVVGTLYGTNVLLPGGIETGPWKFLGRYTTLILIVAVSTAAAVYMYLYFKRKKWF